MEPDRAAHEQETEVATPSPRSDDGRARFELPELDAMRGGGLTPKYGNGRRRQSWDW
ncbi:MAG TPA: hypothetical protein VGP82_24955 [Ktedonobacterales bacterium]|jgi:hypothetical protein|nr:hypothetical protein [Ktedonobacterales bacterium]